jgi:superfamily II DNA or RNA helicase
MKEVWPDTVDFTSVLSDGRNIFHLAAQAGKTEFFEQLRKAQHEEKDKSKKDKNDAMWATLLKQRTDKGHLPIHAAAANSHYQTLIKMKEVWPDTVDLAAVSAEGCNILHLAAQEGKTETILALLKQPMSQPTGTDAAGPSQPFMQPFANLPITPSPNLTANQWYNMTRQEKVNWYTSSSVAQRLELQTLFPPGGRGLADFFVSGLLTAVPSQRNLWFINNQVAADLFKQFPELIDEILTDMTEPERAFLLKLIQRPTELARWTAPHAASLSQPSNQILPDLLMNTPCPDITPDQWRNMTRQEQNAWCKSASETQRVSLQKKFSPGSLEDMKFFTSLSLSLLPTERELYFINNLDFTQRLMSSFDLFGEALTGMTPSQKDNILDLLFGQSTEPAKTSKPDDQIIPEQSIYVSPDLTPDQWRAMTRPEQNKWFNSASEPQRGALFFRLTVKSRESYAWFTSHLLLQPVALREVLITQDLFVSPNLSHFPDLLREAISDMTEDQKRNLSLQPARNAIQSRKPIPKAVQRLIFPKARNTILAPVAPTREKLAVHWVTGSKKPLAGNIHLTKENRALEVLNQDRAGVSSTKNRSFDKITFKPLSEINSLDPSELTCEEKIGSLVRGILCSAPDLSHAKSAQMVMGFDSSKMHLPPQTSKHPTIAIVADKTLQGKSLSFVKQRLEAYQTKNHSFFIPLYYNSAFLGTALSLDEPIESIDSSPDVSMLRMAALDLSDLLQLNEVMFIDGSVECVYLNPKSFTAPAQLNQSESEAFYWDSLLDSLESLKEDYQISLIGIEDLLKDRQKKQSLLKAAELDPTKWNLEVIFNKKKINNTHKSFHIMSVNTKILLTALSEHHENMYVREFKAKRIRELISPAEGAPYEDRYFQCAAQAIVCQQKIVSLSKVHAYTEELRDQRPTNKRKRENESKDLHYLPAETWLNLLPEACQHAEPKALDQMYDFIQSTIESNAKANNLLNLTYISSKQAEFNRQDPQQDLDGTGSADHDRPKLAKVPKNQNEAGPSGLPYLSQPSGFVKQLGQINQEANSSRWRVLKDYLSNLTQEAIHEQSRINPKDHALHKHQLTALHHIGRKSSSQNPSSGLLELATGAGKTRIMTEIIHAFLHSEFKGHISLIAPTSTIANQLLCKLREEFGEDKVLAISSATGHTGQRLIEQLRGGALKESDPKIFVFVAQSFENFVCSQSEKLPYFSLVLVDEIHLATPSQWALYQDCAESEAGLFFGLSATFLDSHKDNFYVFYSYDSAQAENDKISIPWTFHPLARLTKTTLKNPHKAILEALRKPFEKDPTQSLLDFSGMIFVENIAMADALARFLAENNVRAKAVHSQSTNKTRVLQDFKNLDPEGKPKATDPVVKILVAVKSLKEGFDATVDYILYCKNIKPHKNNLAIQKQQNELIQIIGRATRKRPEPLAGFHLPEALIYSLPKNQTAFDDIKRLNLDLNSETNQSLDDEDLLMPDCPARGSSDRSQAPDLDSEATLSESFSES